MRVGSVWTQPSYNDKTLRPLLEMGGNMKLMVNKNVLLFSLSIYIIVQITVIEYGFNDN